MSLAIVLVFVFTPVCALICLVIVALTLLERLSTAEQRQYEKGATRQECLVCGAHEFAPVFRPNSP